MKPVVRIKKAVDRGWNSLHVAMKAAARADSHVKVGVLGDKKNKRRDGEISNVELAVIHEFGTSTIPARSFIWATFEANRAKYKGLLKEQLTAIYKQKSTIEKALGILGATMASDIKARIAAGIPPPNSPEVYARKAAKSYSGAAPGSPVPLVDTGQLLGAITWAVALKGEAK